MLSQLSYTPVPCRHRQFTYSLAYARYSFRLAAFLPRSDFLREFQFGLSLLSFLFRTLKIKQRFKYFRNSDLGFGNLLIALAP